jgi:hypothetical protein
LFFVFVKEYKYDKPIDQPGSKIASVKEDRYYFYNKKIIRWLQANASQNPNPANYKDKATNLLSESKRLYVYMFNCSTALRSSLVRDTVRCKYGSSCPSTGYILKGSRNSCGEAIHVNPQNKKLLLEQ